MNKKTFLAAGALVAVFAGQALFIMGRSEKPPHPKCIGGTATCDVLAKDKYKRVQFSAWSCPDGLAPSTGTAEFLVVGECSFVEGRSISSLLSDSYEDVDFECAWIPPGKKEGKCSRRGVDGGFSDAPSGTTMKPGWWSGDGCQRRTCAEVAGMPWR